ncbi:hypothetical protein BRC61_08030, partial [Halobacteriales archaeon QH_10_65_19]
MEVMCLLTHEDTTRQVQSRDVQQTQKHRVPVQGGSEMTSAQHTITSTEEQTGTATVSLRDVRRTYYLG